MMSHLYIDTSNDNSYDIFDCVEVDYTYQIHFYPDDS